MPGKRSRCVWGRRASLPLLLLLLLAPVGAARPPALAQRVAATAGGVELPGRRTLHSNTYRNPDGTLTTSLFADPVNYRNASGDWRPIDNRLVPSDRAGYA